MQLIALFGLAVFLAEVGLANAAASFSTLYSFQNGSDGGYPGAGLIADAAGNLFGTTSEGGANGDGTVFEIPKTATGYGTPITLVSFDGNNGRYPQAGLIADAAGDLFGTTVYDGPNGGGTVFEIAKTASGYASTPTTLVGFAGSNGANPEAGLIADSAGNLLGTTQQGGVSGHGTVFEIAKTKAGYASIPTILVNFDGNNGSQPQSGLIADAAGNLFGTTFGYGASDSGSMFEIPKTAGGYGTMITLVIFGGVIGGSANPSGAVIIDATGNLFGTTVGGGPNDYGTVFEIAKTASGYASTSEILASFDSNNGAFPYAGLTADAAGNLFGTTGSGGLYGFGTVFEIVKTASGYASAPTTLFNFNGSNGSEPYAGLLSDAAGGLFGTTVGGGPNDHGTVFELSGVGVPLSKNPQTADFNADRRSDILLQNSNGAVAIWEMNGLKAIAAGGLGNPGPAWHVIGAGDFFGSLYADILWQNLSGEVDIWQMNGLKVIASGSPGNPGPNWHAVATGDFNGDGYSDILWQNTNGAVAIWEMNGFKPIASGVIGNPGTAWHVIGAGDFNGDGKSDILFQNTNGAVAIWVVNGLKVLASATIGNPGTAWHVIGAGDFNRDGFADILFQNTNGAVATWEMNGLKRIGGGTVGNPGTAWHVIGSGDYNGDGYSDILWQNTNGAVEIWELDGTKVIASGSPGNPGPAWHAIGE